MRWLRILLLVLLTVAILRAEIPAAVSGEYAEIRSCHVYTCGCLFSGELVTDGRQAILAWSITGGKYGDVSLEGVKAAAVVTGDDNLSLERARRKSVLYLDGPVTPEQQGVLLNLLQRNYAAALGEVVAVRRASILFQSRGDTHTVEIAGTARLVMRKARLPEDAHPGSSRWHQPFIPLATWDLGTVVYSEYTGPDFAMSWRNPEPGINGYSGTFSAGF